MSTTTTTTAPTTHPTPITNTSPASTLLLLSTLPLVVPGTKVRFLGCVDSYSAATGTLILIDSYPCTSKVKVKVAVDVAHILRPDASGKLFEVGAWVCVVGYVALAGGIGAVRGKEEGKVGGCGVRVQAVLMTSAGEGTKSGGAADARYARAVEARRKEMRAMERARREFGT